MEIRIQGKLFTGTTSQPLDASLLVENERVLIYSPSFIEPLALHLSQLKISPRIGQVPRVLETLEGLRFETADFAAVELLEHQIPGKQIVHKLESHWQIAIPIAIALVVTVIFIYQVVIPKYSIVFAPMIPTSFAEKISQPMEKFLESPQEELAKELTAEELGRFQQALQDLRKYFPAKDLSVKLMEEDSPNAFVLPNGHIYVTVGLVELAESSDQIMAVFLHEIGHHERHHVMQSLLENAALSILIVAISGGTEWTNVPLLLMGNKYSRNNEIQADDYSIEKMTSFKKDPKALAEIFELMQKSLEDQPDIPGFLSTHPSFEERILRIRK